MEMNLEGRLKNTRLPPTHALLTLHEAVFNAFHAIEDIGDRGPRHITIQIERDESQVVMRQMKDGTQVAESPVQHVSITDSGIGFTDENLKSFKTSDTQHKAARGGKGVGRFMWLKAFDRVKVESVFEVEGTRTLRTFTFSAPDGVTELADTPAPSNLPRQTTVRLMFLRPPYRKHWPRRLEAIARRLVEHALIYLLREDAPTIEIKDAQELVDVTSMFKDLSARADQRNFSVKGHPMHIRTFRLYGSADTHKLHLCAEEREVVSEHLASVIPDLARKLSDDDSQRFVVSSYVSGPLLDESVTPDRLDFALPESAGNEIMPDVVTKEDVIRAAANQVRDYLRPQLDEIGEEKREHVRRFVEEKKPEYRPVIEYKPEYIEQIPPGLSDEKLDAELHRITYKIEAELREQARAILQQEPDDLTIAEEQVQKFIEVENAFGKSRLASYVVHRKVVLEFLERRLGTDEQGKRPPESAIHELIFPLRKTSEDVPLDQQNLWLIDERLSYHRYLASDVPLNQVKAAEIDSTKRPDLLIFNRPFAFVNTDRPFNSIVLIEFKRPVRDDYSPEENPIDQVYQYVEKIRMGKAIDRSGMHFTVGEGTPFFAYIICDLTPTMHRMARLASLRKTPDGSGYFGYQPDDGTYVEVIAYPKLLADSKQRNRILFEKLALPDRVVI